VPNKPKTPIHSFRVDDDTWKAAQEKARAEGSNLSAVLQDYLKQYLATKRRQPEDAGAHPSD
jgi:hypothetical protein